MCRILYRSSRRLMRVLVMEVVTAEDIMGSNVDGRRSVDRMARGFDRVIVDCRYCLIALIIMNSG